MNINAHLDDPAQQEPTAAEIVTYHLHDPAARRMTVNEAYKAVDEVRAESFRVAAEIAQAEGTRLYDDMGYKAAQGAWSVADKLRALATETAAGGETP